MFELDVCAEAVAPLGTEVVVIRYVQSAEVGGDGVGQHHAARSF